MIFFGITGQIWVRHIYLKPTTAWGWYAAYGYPGYANANEIWAYESGGGGSGGSWTLAGETRYLYDGKRVVQERDGSNTPLVTYTRGKDLSGSLEGAGGIGGLLARSRGYSGGTWTAHHFYHADGSGNVTYMVDNNQAMVASYKYDPFGRTISSGGTLAAANVYQFSSKELHARSGMYYYLYRFYDPNTQRWLNRDPVEEKGGLNLFRFAGNNGVDNFDTFGNILGSHYPGRKYPEGPFDCGIRIKNEVWNSKYGKDRPANDPSARMAHCIAHCRISRECPGGDMTSWLGGFGKEVLDQLKMMTGGGGDGYDPGDMNANSIGRSCGKNKKKSCEDQCQQAFNSGSLYPPPPSVPAAGDWGNYDPITGVAYPL